MKKWLKIIFCAIGIGLICADLSASEIGVLPYRVLTPSNSLPPETGHEYAKLMSFAISLEKTVELSSPETLVRDLKRIGASPDMTLNDNHLDFIGRTHYIDYIVTGDISLEGNGFVSRSVLYSVKDKRIIFRSESRAKDLNRLAESETSDLLVQFPSSKMLHSSPPVDIAFIIDCSHKSSKEKKTIKDAILKACAELTDKLGRDSNIYLIPLSDRISYRETDLIRNSLLHLKNKLSSMRCGGQISGTDVDNALNYALKTLRWRKNLEKHLCIITATEINKISFIEKHGFRARSTGIRINLYGIGNTDRENLDPLVRLAEMTQGHSSFAAYHQIFYLHNGRNTHVYFQERRLFTAPISHHEWEGGILKHNRYDPSLATPLNDLAEVSDTGGNEPSIYDLNGYYEKVTENRIIRSEHFENNLEYLLKNDLLATQDKKKGIISKVMLSDGKINFWIDVHDEQLNEFLKMKHSSGSFFYLPCFILPDSEKTYGLRIQPVRTGIDPDLVPEHLKADLNRLIKEKETYLPEGFSRPPVWILYLKAEEIISVSDKKDIRD